jgi:hypothetical protein
VPRAHHTTKGQVAHISNLHARITTELWCPIHSASFAEWVGTTTARSANNRAKGPHHPSPGQTGSPANALFVRWGVSPWVRIPQKPPRAESPSQPGSPSPPAPWSLFLSARGLAENFQTSVHNQIMRSTTVPQRAGLLTQSRAKSAHKCAKTPANRSQICGQTHSIQSNTGNIAQGYPLYVVLLAQTIPRSLRNGLWENILSNVISYGMLHGSDRD